MSQESTSVAKANLQTPLWFKRLAGPAVCFGVASILFLLFLGHHPLDDWDEAIYADIARNFVRGTSHLIPFWNFQPWLERTPLSEWVTALFFALFGISEFWARAGSALAGAGTVLVVFLFAREWLGSNAAWLAAAILATTPQMFWQARFGTTDAMLTLWMTGSLCGLYRLTTGHSSGWYLLWIGLGLGIMTKSGGPAPLVLTALVVLWSNRRRVRFGRDFYTGLVLLLAIVIPWHLYMWAHFGQRFVDDYIGRQILARSMKTLEGHRGTVFFYVIRIGKGGFPWSLFLLPVLIRIVRLRRMSVVEVYASAVFLFYTAVKTKLPWYITPFYPALALMAASLAVPWMNTDARDRKFRRVAAAAAFAVLAGVMFCLDWRRPYDRPAVLLLKQHPLGSLEGSLILCSDAYILDSPAAVYYTERHVVQAFVKHVPRRVENGQPFDPATNDPKFRDPQPLDRLLSSDAQPILLDRALQKQVAERYALRIIASNANYVLGAIRRHS